MKFVQSVCESTTEKQLLNTSLLSFYTMGHGIGDQPASEVLREELQSLLDRLVKKTIARGGRLSHSIFGERIHLTVGSVNVNLNITKNECRLLWMGKGFMKENTFIQPINDKGRLTGLISVLVDPHNWMSLCKELVQAYANLASQNFDTFIKQNTMVDYYDRLRRKKRELMQIQEYNQKLLSITAHDLSSPLNAVSGYLDMVEEYLQNNENSKKLSRYYRRIQSGVNDVSEMLLQLREVVKFKQNSLSLKCITVDVNWMVKDICEILKANAKKKDITLQVMPKKNPAYIEVDIVKFKRVIYNLVSNAIKYTPAHQHIRVNIKSKNEQVYVCVEDEGMGISGDHLNTIFEPFVKLKADKSNPTSQGLGLYISSYFAELMDGKVTVDSKIGEGSTFTVVMPRAAAPAVQSKPA